MLITANNATINASTININSNNVSHNGGGAMSSIGAGAQNELSNLMLSPQTMFGGRGISSATSLPQAVGELTDPFSGMNHLFSAPTLEAAPQVDEDEFKLFVATVYAEAGNTPSAWEPVADTIMTRVHNKKENVRTVISARHQFTCYIDPEGVNWDNVQQDGLYWNEHGEFLKAWAYQSGKKINQHPAMTRYEQGIIRQLRYDLRQYYDGKISYRITNYYSPRSQKALAGKYPGRYSETPEFLKNIEEPEQYRVYVNGVDEEKFKFYNLE